MGRNPIYGGKAMMKRLKEILFTPSLKGKMIGAFVLTSLIPVIVITAFAYINTSHIVRDNVDEMTDANLRQTRTSLDVWLDSYEDILFQIYMNDDIVEMTKALNRNEDTSFVSGRLRKNLRGMFYTKEHIKAITVITDNGTVVFYDLLTGAVTQSSWLDTVGMSQEEIRGIVSQSNRTTIIPTKKAGFYEAKDYYLFHMGHRILDYRDVNKQLGVVIVSVDEKLLQDILSGPDSGGSLSFMVDTSGTVVSAQNKEQIGEKMIDWSDDSEERKWSYTRFVSEQIKDRKLDEQPFFAVNTVFDEKFGCDIVSISNQNEVISRLQAQQRIMITVILISVLVLAVLIAALLKNLMGSIRPLIQTMQAAGKGDLSARTAENPRTPAELRIIETQFNRMLEKLQTAIEREKEAGLKQKDAEIEALEAQINPHFLYNTLDTINWMAIDHDEYEISNAITSLAAILRYGIDKSNEIVTVQRECQWLKEYLFLQQTRLKNSFECQIDAAPELMDWKIHKLLLQPFVENSIIHGFETQKPLHILRIAIRPAGEDSMEIEIWDNGKGIPSEMAENMNRGVFVRGTDRNCIGMENAITRIKMYYGDRARIEIKSEVGEYTGVYLTVPKMEDKSKEEDT